ncbi:TetR/AcrR family transcriptional regulator [Amycolatopsis anabasis]|uniref:TetR/AcrR family transcriptional regulator n=1 Tax=Amycolatopsis anabasis TaxID=1840409 RepID=UPI00131D7DE1|nr:TetR/AcrR family transcriptional regulator [Amycolatopsis anabasis]
MRRYHHGDLRAALLERAEQTLREKGVEALSLRELARDIGVSHAAPSRHFKDKRALLDALALAGFERLLGDLERAGRTEGAFTDRLVAVARAYVDFAVGDAELLDVMYTGKHAPDASAELTAAGHRMGVLMHEVLAEGQRAGEVRAGDPGRIALAAFAALHGFASLAASAMVPVEGLHENIGFLVEDLLLGLRPRG